MVRAAVERGAALVTAMLIAALAAAIVAALAGQQAQWLNTVELRRDRAQAQAIVLAGLAWTRRVLHEDALADDIDHPGEPWALRLPPTPLEGGSVEGAIVDAQARLDLNHLAGDGAAARAARERLTRLLARAGLASGTVEALAAATRGDDARWTRAAEAAALDALGEGGYARIAPFVTALPREAALNVNTAAPELLAAAVDGLDADALAALVADRARRPYRTLGEFRSRLPPGASVPSDAGLDVRSAYFLVTVRARQGDTLAQGRALVHRRGRDVPEVVWQVVE
jgi:general secretion pathway protein K